MSAQDADSSASEQLFEVLADMEARAGALHHRERVEEVADRSRSAYAEVTLESRLMASCGAEIACEVRWLGRVGGRLERVGAGWLLVEAERALWLIPTQAVVAVRGLSDRSVPREAWSPTDRLGLGARARRLADARARVSVHLDGGGRREGVLVRVGADFLEVEVARDGRSGAELELMPWSAVVAIGTPR